MFKIVMTHEYKTPTVYVFAIDKLTPFKIIKKLSTQNNRRLTIK